MMRSVVVATFGLSLAGCATVSVVPSETTIATETTAEQSALRSASDLYCERAEAEGWIKPSSGIVGLASILMRGGGDDNEPAGSYADRIDAASALPQDVLRRIEADALSARKGLIGVREEADALLASPEATPGRLDVTAFERALVRAQLANRGFGEALGIVAGRSVDPGMDPAAAADPARAAVEAFAQAIDAARPVADALAARYADRPVPGTGAATS